MYVVCTLRKNYEILTIMMTEKKYLLSKHFSV